MKLCASQVKTLPSVAVLFGLAFANNAIAGVITLNSGLITQTTSDGTGPAVNNPNLNNILDTQGGKKKKKKKKTALGNCDLPGARPTFLDTSASVSHEFRRVGGLMMSGSEAASLVQRG